MPSLKEVLLGAGWIVAVIVVLVKISPPPSHHPMTTYSPIGLVLTPKSSQLGLSITPGNSAVSILADDSMIPATTVFNNCNAQETVQVIAAAPGVQPASTLASPVEVLTMPQMNGNSVTWVGATAPSPATDTVLHVFMSQPLQGSCTGPKPNAGASTGH